MGYNVFGQLGLSDRNYRCKPVSLKLQNIISIACGGVHAMALEKTGILYMWGSNYYGQLGLGFKLHDENFLSIQINSIKYIKNIMCKDSCSIVTTVYGDIYVWGNNQYGQLGLGDYDNKHEPCKLEFPS